MKLRQGEWYVALEDFAIDENKLAFVKDGEYLCMQDGILSSDIGQHLDVVGMECIFKPKSYTEPTSKGILQGFDPNENTPRHYDNTNGSLYKFCDEKDLNSYEFDIIKRVMRCRKKGQFIADLESTKVLIDLYIQEQKNNHKIL